MGISVISVSAAEQNGGQSQMETVKSNVKPNEKIGEYRRQKYASQIIRNPSARMATPESKKPTKTNTNRYPISPEPGSFEIYH